MNDIMTPRQDVWGFMKLQNCILHIAKYIDSICEANAIEYCLMGGSALGAVRHKGFIPWDDDLDIFMTPDNYEKFREVHNNTSGFYLQEWGADKGKITRAKVRLDKSTYIEELFANWDIHQGVFVDIFILHVCPENPIKRYWQYFWAKYLVTMSVARRGLNERGGFKGGLIRIAMMLPKRFLLGYALNQVYRFRNEKSQYLCHFMGRALLKKGLYKRCYFDEVKKIKFEEIELYVPAKVEEYLRDRWGDYMKLPSMDDIKKYQHCWNWSVSEYFPGFKQNAEYKDECYL
ncbi:MAG: LicD family protein [Bacteroides sp.]|nr:LicD family protein [Bacteroides sp.]